MTVQELLEKLWDVDLKTELYIKCGDGALTKVTDVAEVGLDDEDKVTDRTIYKDHLGVLIQ